MAVVENVGHPIYYFIIFLEHELETDEAILGDGRRPRCRGCEVRGLTCLWGLKASFHSSRNISLSDHQAAVLREIEQRRRRRPSWTWHRHFIDETKDVVDEYLGIRDPPDELVFTEEEHSHPRSSELPRSSLPLDAAELSIADIFTHLQASDFSVGIGERDHQLSSSTEPRVSTISEIADSARQAHLYPSLIDQAPSNDITPQQAPQLPVTGREKIRLLSAYVRGTGTWCETTDSEMHFTVKSIHKMMESPPFVAAALSLASRQLDYLQGQHRPMTLELYQFTIQLLLCQNHSLADESILAACTLLCVYEMMASPVEEWRRHLRGCAAFLHNKRWNGSSDGIIKASFWAFARIGK